MNTTTIIRRFSVVIVAVVALALAVGATAGNTRPAGMSKAEYRALMLRSQALDHKYGLDSTSFKPAGMSAAEYRALMLRSRALDRIYGLDKPQPVVVSAAPTSTRGFGWTAFGIGAAAMLGLVLVAGGVALGGRALRQVSPVETS
jgi:hypothetical protein